MEEQVKELEAAAQAFEAEEALLTMDGAKLFISLGAAHAELGSFDDAMQAFNEAKKALKANRMMRGQIALDLYGRIGEMKLAQGEVDSAYDELTRARKMMDGMSEKGELEANEAPMEFARVLANLGSVQAEMGDLDSSAESLAAARDLLRTADLLDSTRMGAEVLERLGDTNLEAGDLEFAEQDFGEALAALQATGRAQPERVAALHSRMGHCKLQAADLKGALEEHSEAHRILQEVDTITPAFAETFANIAIVHARDGQLEDAVVGFTAAKEVLEELGSLESDQGARILQNLGIALTQAGRAEEAAGHLEAAREILLLQGDEEQEEEREEDQQL